jgi:hypothetical protein
LYPPGNKNCEIFGLKFKEFEWKLVIDYNIECQKWD